jgi:rhamnopyranosyl-N-acetylglucosaminyl-diphospho-decaprenol beta-1,3/1,4-galactofuranosyltransferase
VEPHVKPHVKLSAVVVTFNRLALLERLLLALSQQEELAEIVVVNNNSTDGTGVWLSEYQPTGPPIHVVDLPENVGGAGGFHAGMKEALNRGAGLIWLMDDDGVPQPDCLAQLLEHVGEFDFWGPVVVAEQDPQRLCFPIRLPGRAFVVHNPRTVAEAATDGVLRDIVIPFNGVLVTAELVNTIGLVRADLFVWGDDVEYLWRAQRANARTATIVSAVFRHPATDDLGTPMAFGKATYNHSPSDLKHYCMARNNLRNLLDYKGQMAALAFVAKTAWFYGFTKPSLARLRLSAQGMIAALRGDFTGHRRFL